MKVEVCRTTWNDKSIALQINKDGSMYLRDLREWLEPVTSVEHAVGRALQSVRQRYHTGFVVYLPDGADIPEELLALGIETFALDARAGRYPGCQRANASSIGALHSIKLAVIPCASAFSAASHCGAGQLESNQHGRFWRPLPYH